MEKLLTREEVPKEETWDLGQIYSDPEWEQAVQQVEEMLPQLSSYVGRLNSADALQSCLQVRDQIDMLLEKVYAYAFMKSDEDNTDSVYQGFSERARTLTVKTGQTGAFIEPSIVQLDGGLVEQWIEQTPGLKVYAHYLHEVLRQKEHTLNAEQEQLLAAAADLAQVPGRVFNMFNDADLQLPLVQDEEGNDVQLTHGRYLRFMESSERRVRKGAYTGLYSTFQSWTNTLAANLSGAVKQARFYAEARKYPSSLEAALDGDNVKPQVYHNLIETVHRHLPTFYRYMKLRRQRLGVEQLHMYDIYAPIVPDEKMSISYDEARHTVTKSLTPLGKDYQERLHEAFENRWIDVRESKGKTSGAYSFGVYGVHPFVLLNYEDTVDNMFTLAHELGHAMHSYYSDNTQEYVNASYPIFLAEVASTVNESLLIDHLLRQERSKNEQMYLINHYLEQFRGTLFRQTMFAEFELLIHNRAQQGEALTAQSLSEMYASLNRQYYGEGVVTDAEIAVEWARIPHFYRPFYVYKYATGFSAAAALSRMILDEGEPAVTRYLEFLASGGKDYPLVLLEKAGVDMSEPGPIDAALEVFSKLLDRFEQLAAS